MLSIETLVSARSTAPMNVRCTWARSASSSWLTPSSLRRARTCCAKTLRSWEGCAAATTATVPWRCLYIYSIYIALWGMTSQTALRGVFDISDWRSSTSARRELLRSIIARATVGGEQLEPMVEELKRALGAQNMSDADRNLLHVTIHDLRTIIGGWARLAADEQRLFLAGKGAPSSLAARLRKSRD